MVVEEQVCLVSSWGEVNKSFVMVYFQNTILQNANYDRETKVGDTFVVCPF